MTKTEILKITDPTKLFSKVKIKSEYRELAKQWHPDLNGNKDGDVFLHIESLYKAGLKLIKDDLWEIGIKSIVYRNDKGKKIVIRYKKIVSFELGEFYICQKNIIYFVRLEFKSLVYNSIERLSKINYANSTMESEFSKFIGWIDNIETVENGFLLISKRPENAIRLYDVLEYFDNKLHSRHVAWIMSSLYNLCCFLNFNHIVHNNISLDNYFVSPENHFGILYGWWYVAEINNPLIALPKRTIENTRYDSKNAKPFIDLELIRLLGKELLGDASGSHLRFDKEIPDNFILWLCTATSNHAIDEYKNWNEVILNSWGKREFFEMKLPHPFYK